MSTRITLFSSPNSCRWGETRFSSPFTFSKISSMKNILWLLLGVLMVASACTDEELDPLQFHKIQKGSILTLRGEAFSNLSNRDFKGASDRFSIAGDISKESFTFETDFLSEDPSSIARVITYARAEENGPRVQVAVTEGSAFRAATPDDYPRATISIPLSTILTALKAQASDFAPTAERPVRYIFIENDLELKDGTIVPANAVVNSSLFESALFYPAHNLRYLATN